MLCLACAAGAAAATPASNPVPAVGVADDAPKYADDGGEAIYQRLRGLGMRETRMVVDFDPAEPKTIQEKAFLDRSVDKAVAAGVEVVFSVYPHVPRTFATDTAARIAAFGSYLALLARTYPQVKRFIVLNEPNEGYFFAPQFSARKNVSAAIAEKVLATAYDRLKRVDPSITVIGLGLSPDGNGVTSTAPVRFIQALGAAYRASHRRRPIMDELAYHIHPRDSRTFDGRTHFRWPNGGPADLDRIKQAVWDAFHGTGQPTFAEAGTPQGAALAAPQPLRFVLAEVAVQVGIPPALAPLYTSSENVPVATEAWQAKAYVSLLRTFACDPSVADVLLFLLIDQPDLGRYQSWLMRLDGSERPAYDAVRGEIADLADCGTERSWRHAVHVFGARVAFGSQTTFPAKQRVLGVSVTAGEDATAKAGLFRIAGPGAPVDRKLLSRRLNRAAGPGAPILADVARVKARFLPRLEVRGTLPRGYYRWVVRLRSVMNTGRTSLFVGPVLRVG